MSSVHYFSFIQWAYIFVTSSVATAKLFFIHTFSYSGRNNKSKILRERERERESERQRKKLRKKLRTGQRENGRQTDEDRCIE